MRKSFAELPDWAQSKMEEIRTTLDELDPGSQLNLDTLGYTIKNNLGDHPKAAIGDQLKSGQRA
jgi:hypothetical protein